MNGLPEITEPQHFYQDSQYQYLITRRQGIFRRSIGNREWQLLSDSIYKRKTIYPDIQEYRTISAFTHDRSKPGLLFMATKHTVYSSNDYGSTWKVYPVPGFEKRHFITALSSSNGILSIGTSYRGVYVKRGTRFYRIYRGLPGEPYSAGHFFNEEITALHQSGSTLYAGTLHGIYALEKGSSTWKKIYQDTSDTASLHYVESLQHADTTITGTYKDTLITIASSGITEKKHDEYPAFTSATDYKIIVPRYEQDGVDSFHYTNAAAPRPDTVADNKRAIYTSIYKARTHMDYYVSIIKRTRINALVIDMKDDTGNLFFPTDNELARRIGSLRSSRGLDAIIARCKKEKIYCIARFVVFKDMRLFKGEGYTYAIKNIRTGYPWRGLEGEYWVDPYSKTVQQYNIDLAKDIEKAGFDEVQFDYIRFPADGPVHLCRYTHQPDVDMYKSEALVDFLEQAQKELTIPISVDIYGFNSWYKFGNWIGQDMEAFSYVVDAISPMVYPSHFGNRFYMTGPRSERPYRIVFHGGIRARRMAGNRTVIRPYLQAFNLLSPTWGPGYIEHQIQGAEKSNQDGFIFWNAAGKYQLLPHVPSLKP